MLVQSNPPFFQVADGTACLYPTKHKSKPKTSTQQKHPRVECYFHRKNIFDPTLHLRKDP